jgi:3-hydroxyisobutyrate dehydrogenase-like beta-hydroxyacid dehydrogenase
MINRIGVIGLGKMGLPMVRHLLAGKHEVAVYDVVAGAIDRAVELGATPCADPRQVAERSQLMIVAVGFDSEVIEVVEAPNGLLAGAGPNSIIAVASTVLPETMTRLAETATKSGKGVDVLDIPLCRGEPAAEKGELLLLAGGNRETFERARPALRCFANDLYLLGGLGAGQVGKMINNLLLRACVSANHEGLKLGEALGVDSEVLREALLQSSGRNWALETWLQPRPMPWAEKDMAFVMHEADECRLSLPLCGVVKEVIKGIKIEKGLTAPKARKPA